AALVKAYRDRNYRVVATARSMKPSSDADVLVISGDIADRKTAERQVDLPATFFARFVYAVNRIITRAARPTDPPELCRLTRRLVLREGSFCDPPHCSR